MLTCLAGQNIYHVCFPIEKYLLGRKDTVSGYRICALCRGSFVLCTFLQFQGQQLDKACQGSLLSQDYLPPSLTLVPSSFPSLFSPLPSLLSLPFHLSSPPPSYLCLFFSPHLLFRDKVSLYSPSRLKPFNPPASASAAPRWQVFVVTHSSSRHFLTLVCLLLSQFLLTL